jgi:hypothetical protein
MKHRILIHTNWNKELKDSVFFSVFVEKYLTQSPLGNKPKHCTSQKIFVTVEKNVNDFQIHGIWKLNIPHDLICS